jgi:hypothetical protein
MQPRYLSVEFILLPAPLSGLESPVQSLPGET